MSALTDNEVLDRLDDPDISQSNKEKLEADWETIQEDQRQATMSTGSRFIENTVSATVFHGLTAAVFHYYAYLSGVFGQETYHDNEDFTQKTIFVLVSESSLLMAPDIALIMVLMGAGCVEVFNALSKIENVVHRCISRSTRR
jgi:hypothetical protein